ncbi:LapA family protein [Blastococcus jejuensis]|uniref:LapA family protein n=1 Tax=Blastococcus jejuensis TaxID=351224 RepID=UPI0031D81AC2
MSLHDPSIDPRTAQGPTAGGPPPVAPQQRGQVAPPPPPPARPSVPRTRTGVIWVTVCVGALLAVALIVFMVQNTQTVEVTFLGMTGSTSLALMLLIAAVGGVLVTLILGSARIIQLRHQAHKRR